MILNHYNPLSDRKYGLGTRPFMLEMHQPDSQFASFAKSVCGLRYVTVALGCIPAWLRRRLARLGINAESKEIHESMLQKQKLHF